MDIDSLSFGDLLEIEWNIRAVALDSQPGGWVYAAASDPGGELMKRDALAIARFQSDFRKDFESVMKRIMQAGDSEVRDWTEDDSFFMGYDDSPNLDNPLPFPGLRTDLVDNPVAGEFDAFSFIQVPGDYSGPKARWPAD